MFERELKILFFLGFVFGFGFKINMAGHSDQNIVDHAAEMEEYENNPNYSIRLHRGLDLNVSFE